MTRITTKPDSPPPPLTCPKCDQLLTYRQTVIGGVQNPERWDYYECPTCGVFKYAEGTRRLSSVLLD